MRFSRELLKLYSNNIPLKYKLYTLIRCAICPFIEIEKYVPPDGKILDFGCGHGLFANLLALKSNSKDVIGIDINAQKINIAKRTLGVRKNIDFRIGDLESCFHITGINCFIFIDVLNCVPVKKQKESLRRLYSILQDDGMVIIKSIQEFPNWKYWWTLFHMAVIEKVVHKNFKKNSYFIKKEDFLMLLEEIGFKVQFKDLSKGYTYSHCLYVCSKA